MDNEDVKEDGDEVWFNRDVDFSKIKGKQNDLHPGRQCNWTLGCAFLLWAARSFFLSLALVLQ